MSKNKLVFANWKMNLDINSSNKLIKEILDRNLNYENIDFVIKVPSKDTGTIQTVTQVIYHSICQALEI